KRRGNIAFRGECDIRIAREPLSGRVCKRHERGSRPIPCELCFHRATLWQDREGALRIADQRQRGGKTERCFRCTMRLCAKRQPAPCPFRIKGCIESRLRLKPCFSKHGFRKA